MIRINNLHVEYRQGTSVQLALQGVSLDINEGDYIALVGPSGSGKSSLIAAVCGLVFPHEGDIFVDKYRINRISRARRAFVRSRYFSVIFQFSELLGRFTVRENLELSWISSHGFYKRGSFQDRLDYLVSRLDLYPLLDRFPHELSGGQLQKAAIARALIRDLSYILADEPSGDLDPESFLQVKNLFLEEQERGKGILLVTHDMKLAFDAKTIYELRQGKITGLLKGN
ncbi:MAG: ATP-binding cassette domain-containing protein [Leptospiraceae bacterium]|nr:ATP-binding cassette domain-containing protein [Leptospiraceae bacterium]MDW8305627.1 ATP-binding cassette domain-containing protein [Leptospiraceae bacterium]